MPKAPAPTGNPEIGRDVGNLRLSRGRQESRDALPHLSRVLL